MARDTASVNTGLSSTRLPPPPMSPTMRQTERSRSNPLNLRPGEREFRSRASGFRLLVKATRDIYDPLTGRRVPGDLIVARFTPMSKFEGRLRTSDPFIIAHLEGYKGYGLGMEIWDAEQARIQTIEAASAQVIEQVRQSPELAARLKEMMDHDYVMPGKVTGEAGSSRPSLPPAPQPLSL